MRGQGRVYRRGDVWWIDYSVGGTRHREPTKATEKRGALDVLRQRVEARVRGVVVGRPERVTLAELRALAERQYVLDGRRSAVRLGQAFNNVERVLGKETRAPALSAALLDQYAEQRLAEGAARATVNYELAAVRRAFRLAVEKGLLAVPPIIKLPRVRNARAGFFDDGDFAALLVELPPDVRALVQFLRLTGWRKGEALALRWAHVDLAEGVVRLAAQDTKGGDARSFPFRGAPDLTALFERQWATRDGAFVFQRGGKALGVGAVREAWARACKRAGLAGRLIHDLRRTAARDFRQAGVAEGEIMKLCGWKTREMFARYNVLDARDLERAVARRFAASGTAAAQTALPPAPEKLLS